jgi:hypothetical protein
LSALFIAPQCGHDTGATVVDAGTEAVVAGAAGDDAAAAVPAMGAPHVSHHSGSADVCPLGQIDVMARA